MFINCPNCGALVATNLATDLPPEEEIRRLRMPVLLLAWPQDDSHPLEVAQHLLEVLPDARLEVARTPAEVAAWPQVVADFVRAHRD